MSGRDNDPAPPDALYSLRSVQAMLGLSRAIVSGLMAEGFVAPTRGRRNEWRFSFQDLLLLRSAHALQTAGIPPRKILRALARLKAALPQELPLSGLRITAIGAEVAVRSPQGPWQADSGQMLMDFDVAPQAGSVVFLARETTPSQPSQPAEPAGASDCFARGLALETIHPQAAETAYREALALAPDLEAAYLNLGAMYSDAGRHEELRALCDEALRHCAPSALIHFNRGVALDHMDAVADAITSYEHSLALDPTLADAHYNLARLREQLGDKRGALRHFSAYRRLQR